MQADLSSAQLTIAEATPAEYDQLAQLDHHVPASVIGRKIEQGEIIVACQAERVMGWLRYSYFWDIIPFMNMLTVREGHRGQGIGTQLVTYWEQTLRERGFTEALTSTQANERGQFLYRKLGYHDCGALLLPGEPLELIMRKVLQPVE
jgi:ribosomal protein S18 acetylase RimI-like enzyme